MVLLGLLGVRVMLDNSFEVVTSVQLRVGDEILWTFSGVVEDFDGEGFSIMSKHGDHYVDFACLSGDGVKIVRKKYVSKV